MKRVFTAGVTHELRSPLIAIESYVNEMIRGGVEGFKKAFGAQFGFDFELTDLYRQVEIWTMDGAVQRGVITYAWDIDTPGFNIVLFVDKFSPLPPPSIHFMFSDVKAIKFYRGQDKRRIRALFSLSGSSSKKAIVHFKDDSTLECRLPKGAHEESKRIFALPLRGGKNVDYYVVVGENVSRIQMI